MKRIAVLFSDGSMNVYAADRKVGRISAEKAAIEECDGWNEREPKDSPDRARIVTFDLPDSALKPWRRRAKKKAAKK